MDHIEFVVNNSRDVLEFLKSRVPLYHRSNLFFRDVQFGIQAMLIRAGKRISYAEAERAAAAFVEKLEKDKIVRQIDQQSWVLEHPDYRTPVRKKAEAPPGGTSKPAPGAAASPAA